MKCNWNSAVSWLKQRSLFFRAIPDKLESIEKVSYSILKIALALTILYYLTIIVYWTTESDCNLYIEPFKTGGAGQDIDGSSLANILQNQMQNIREISMPDEREGIKIFTKPLKIISVSGYETNYSVMNLAIPIDVSPVEQIYITPGETDLISSLNNLGSINIEGTSLSIGQLILSLKELRHNRPDPISCTIQKLGPVVSITGTYHNSKNNQQTFTWNVVAKNLTQDDSTDEPIALLIEDLAYQITYSLGKSKSIENETYPRNWRTYKKLLQSLEAYKSYVETEDIDCLNRSMSLMREAHEFEPHYVGSLRKSMLYDIGSACLSEEEYNLSVGSFESLSLIEPEIGYYGLALAYYGKGDFERSLININKVITLDSGKDAYSWLIKGLILIPMSDYKNAVICINNAIDKDETLEWAWFLKGIISFEAVMTEHKKKGITIEGLNSIIMKDSLYNFNRVLDLNPNNSWALFSMGRILRDESPQEALSLFDKAIKFDPENAFAWNEKGNSLMILGRYEEALEAKEVALEISPNKYNFWLDKGILLNQMNRSKEAEKCFEISRELELELETT